MTILTPSLKDTHFIAIGKIVSLCAIIDASIEKCIWFLIGIPAIRGTIITSSMSTTPRKNLMLALAQQSIKNPITFEEMRKNSAKVESLLNLRNYLVHGQWYIPKSTNEPTAYISPERPKSYADGLKMKSEQFSLERLESIIIEADMLATYFDTLWRAIYAGEEKLHKNPHAIGVKRRKSV